MICLWCESANIKRNGHDTGIYQCQKGTVREEKFGKPDRSCIDKRGIRTVKDGEGPAGMTYI
ncbi:MAG: hypothetical protein ACTSRA_08280 [Promethearchaeota archaeon]